MIPTSIDGTDITGATIDGTDVTEITVDGQTVFTAVPDIPNTVVHQYRAEDFADPWPDNIGSADMSVSGLTSSTFNNNEDSVFGDGIDDHGTANGPQNFPQNETFGIAFTASFSSISEFSSFLGVSDQSNTANSTRIFTGLNGPNGAIEPWFGDGNENNLSVYTVNTFDDGSPHAIIVNKNGNSASDISIYVDDMSTQQSIIIERNENFDHTTFNQSGDLAFYARNNTGAGNIIDHISADIGIFEFNSEPYNQTEREDFVSRRPEV